MRVRICRELMADEAPRRHVPLERELLDAVARPVVAHLLDRPPHLDQHSLGRVRLLLKLVPCYSVIGDERLEDSLLRSLLPLLRRQRRQQIVHLQIQRHHRLRRHLRSDSQGGARFNEISLEERQPALLRSEIRRQHFLKVPGLVGDAVRHVVKLLLKLRVDVHRGRPLVYAARSGSPRRVSDSSVIDPPTSLHSRKVPRAT
mmetsp:Transcript_67911/g.162149  ORF Transcript_67911/g.162149 Transcript_67911/m.162149 type:complete len:202 (-) Transcript_67911:1-606(-)